MTLPSTVVYRVAPKSDDRGLPPDIDQEQCFFLFNEVVIISREPSVEAPAECTARAKVAFLGMYWDSIPATVADMLFGDERDPVKMFDMGWTITRYTPIVALRLALECVSPRFIASVRPYCDEETGALLDSLDNLS